MSASKSTASRLVGGAVHSLVVEVLHEAQAKVARDASTGAIGKDFDRALAIAKQRGFPDERAREFALAALLQNHTERIAKTMLAGATDLITKSEKVPA